MPHGIARYQHDGRWACLYVEIEQALGESLRLPVELTDVRPADVTIGMTVEMTFRRLNTSDGIANYFWKARPVRRGGAAEPTEQGSD